MKTTTTKFALQLYCLFVLWLSIAKCMAQYSPTAERTFSLLNPGDDYRVLELYNQWILAVYEEDHLNGTSTLHAKVLNHDLEPVWEYATKRVEHAKLVGVGVDGGNALVLRQLHTGDFDLMQLDLQSGEQSFKNLRAYPGFVAQKMVVAGSTCFVAGQIDGSTCAFKICHDEPQMHILFHHSSKKTNLLALEVGEAHRTVSFVSASESQGGTDVLFVNHYDFEGGILGNFAIRLNPGMSLSGLQVAHLGKSELLLTGTLYKGIRKGESGIFTAVIKERSIEAFRVYDYARFEHFLKFLPPKAEKQIRRKAGRRTKKGGFFSWPYHFEPLMLTEEDGQWMAVGNVFENRWITEQEDGLQYAGIAAYGLDRKGRLIWDNSMPYSGVEIILSDPVYPASAKLRDRQICFVQQVGDVLRSKISAKKEFAHYVYASLLEKTQPEGKQEYLYKTQFMPLQQQGFLYFGLKEVVEETALERENMLFFLKKLEAVPSFFAETDE